MDKGHKDADKKLKKLEKSVKKQYDKAYKEISGKANDWLAQFKEADAKKYQQLVRGEIGYNDYIQWRKDTMLASPQMKKVCEDLSKTMTDYNVQTMGMVNNHALSVFVENYNYGAYEVCKGANANFAFNLVDEKTVNNLSKEQRLLLPKAKVDREKDLAWNAKKINSALGQGIIQGDSMNNIAKRLKQVAKMDESSAIRSARTMTTAAENGGRQAVYEDAEAMGIELQKTWVATLDDRTRDAHIELDGVTVPVDEKFTNSIGDIMYPADPSADGENCYNCRCTLISSVKGYKRDTSSRAMSGSLGNWTYETWKKDAMERIEEKKKRA